MMPNKCNPRIKPNNPDSVQKRIEPRVMFAALNTQQDRRQRVLNTLSHLEISSQYRLKSGLKGSNGKIDAGEMSETEFIQPVKKAVSIPQDSAISTKHLRRRVQCGSFQACDLTSQNHYC